MSPPRLPHEIASACPNPREACAREGGKQESRKIRHCEEAEGRRGNLNFIIRYSLFDIGYSCLPREIVQRYLTGVIPSGGPAGKFAPIKTKKTEDD